MKIEEQIEQLEFIKQELQKGKNKKDVMLLIKKQWNIKDATFNHLFAAAKLMMFNEQRQIKPVYKEIEDEKTKALAEQVMTPIERKVYLSKIARGEIMVEKGFAVSGTIKKILVPPTASERIAAIVELNKMENLYEQEKQKIIKDNKLEVKIIIPDISEMKDKEKIETKYEIIDSQANGNQADDKPSVC